MCGIFGKFNEPSKSTDKDQAANDAFLGGLLSFEHRGTDGNGLAVSDGQRIESFHSIASIGESYTDDVLGKLKGHIAVAQTRYGTEGARKSLTNTQPLVFSCRLGQMALCHNGNLTNTEELRSDLSEAGAIFATDTDTEIIYHLIARSRKNTIEGALVDAMSQIRGAFSLIIMTKDKLYGIRDTNGFRPLTLGRHDDNSWFLASETCGFDLIGAKRVREVEPGEMVVIDDVFGPKSVQWAQPSQQRLNCIFEHVYFARPDSEVFGQSVAPIRIALGRNLAKQLPTEADIVVPVPDSGNYAAEGYAMQSGLRLTRGIMRNHSVGRTFISSSARVLKVKIKLNAIRSLLEGKDVILVDDSIVRGHTSRRIVRMVKAAGAKKVHLRISCPPTISPCYYGVDTPQAYDLIAAKKSIQEICNFVEADSLDFLSLDGLLDAVGDTNPAREHCVSCYTGVYPVDLVPSWARKP